MIENINIFNRYQKSTFQITPSVLCIYTPIKYRHLDMILPIPRTTNGRNPLPMSCSCTCHIKNLAVVYGCYLLPMYKCCANMPNILLVYFSYSKRKLCNRAVMAKGKFYFFTNLLKRLEERGQVQKNRVGKKSDCF